MPVRYATRRYPDLPTFLRDHQANLRKGMLLLPAGTLDDEPALEMKVDLMVPGSPRIGPLEAQVIRRFVDGAVALQLTKVPDALQAAVVQAETTVREIEGWLLETGRVGPPASAAELEALRTRVAQLEEALARAEVARGELARAYAVASRGVAADAVGGPTGFGAVGGPIGLGAVGGPIGLGAVGGPIGLGAVGGPEGAGAVDVGVPAGAAAPEAGAAAGPLGGPSSPAPRAVATTRGFPLPDLSRVPPRLTGTVGTLVFRQALMALAVDRATGILTLRTADGRLRWGFWAKGGPVGWRAEPVEEQEALGMLLLRANQISKEQLRQSLDLMEQRGYRQGDALIEMGVLTFAQLVMVLQKQTEFVMQRVLAMQEGTWTFHDLPEHVERFMPPPVRVAAMLFRSLRTQAKEMPTEELAGALRTHLDQYVYLANGVERTLEEMRMSADEQLLMKIIAGTSYRLRELSSVSSLSRSATATMVYCLLQLGLLEFRDEEAAARGGGRLARDLLSRKGVAQKGTYFDRLEIHWICTGTEVEAAWRRLSTQFSVEQAGRFGAEWEETVLFIARALAVAYERLRTDKGRREYRAEVIEKMMIDQSALMLAGKGDMELLKSNFKEALDCYTKAVELVPTSGEFNAGLQKVRAAAGG